MPEDIHPQTTVPLDLHEAFNLIGRAIFDAYWREDCVRLSYSPLWHELDLGNLTIPDPTDPESMHEQEQYGVEWASPRQIDCFEQATEALYEALWHGEIKAIGIAADGTEEDIPKQAWMDQTGQFQISIGDSEVTQKTDKNYYVWRVRIDERSLPEAVERLESIRKADEKAQDTERRKRDARLNRTGGAPPKYDWPHIDALIRVELNRDERKPSNAEVARRVAKATDDEGTDPPMDSALRDRVKKVKEERPS